MHARVIVAVAEPYLGQPLVPVIKPGAGATIGTAYVAKKPADGYTTLIAAPTPFYRTLIEELPYTLETFTSIGMISMDPLVIVTHADNPYQNLGDLIAAAKANPEETPVSIVGTYGMQHVTLSYIAQQENMEFKIVPFEGGGPNLTAVLGKHIHAGWAIPAMILGHLEAGTIRALAVCGPTRYPHEQLKDVPTLREQGYDWDMALWIPWQIRADTPGPILERLRQVYTQIMADKSFQKLTAKMGMTPTPMSARESDLFMKGNVAGTKKVIDWLKMK